MINKTKLERQEMLNCLAQLSTQLQDENQVKSLAKIKNFITEKRYGLVWEEHSEQVETMLVDNVPVFIENPEKTITTNKNQNYNFLLEGDNLHSLLLLQKTHKEKIDVIYIDPPYNTGNKGFIYEDRYIESSDSYLHSKWLSFISKRLKIARNLLSDNGLIFISIDDHEQAQLKLICDEIFGQENFLGNLIWKSKSGGANNTSYFGIDHEYIVVYAKNASQCKIKNDVQATVTTSYNKVDDLGRRYALDRLDKQSLGYQKTLDFPIIGPDGQEYTVFHKDPLNKKARWRWSKDTVKQRYDELVFIYPYVYTKNYEKTNGAKPRSILYDERFGRTRTGSSDLKKVIGTQSVFTYPKPIKLIKYLLSISTEKSSIILDFFAGSGTTGHAVAKLNQEDGGNRTYILCTNNENNICEEITYQRLHKIQAELPHNLKYFKTAFIPYQSTEPNLLKSTITYTKELIELENHRPVDGINIGMLECAEDFDAVVANLVPNSLLYIAQDLPLSDEQKYQLSNRNIQVINIPSHFYSRELIEAPEM